MKKQSNEYRLCTNDLKILETVSSLNKDNKYPLTELVYKILIGSEDQDIEEFKNLPTYKTLVSYPSKKVSRLVVMLIRYSFLERIYDEATNELYLKVAPKGEMELIKYHKKHKYKFTTKQVKKKQLYVTIEKNWKFKNFNFFIAFSVFSFTN